EEVASGAAQVDLVLNLMEVAGGLKGWLEYNTDLFEGATMKRLLAQFEGLLTAVVADPDQPIATLPLLTKAEQELLAAWNATADPYPTDRGVHQLVEQQAVNNPAATAVVDGSETLTYAELNRRANQVAYYLRSLGVRPETCVAVCLHRSADLIVGMLGILKAGAAYLPLDPDMPPSRLRFMLDDSHAPIVLTQASLTAVLPPDAARLVCLDADWPTIMRQPETDPGQVVCVEQLAYLIYTSGSTGQPKGVAVPQRALLNLVAWHQRAVALSPRDRTTHLAGLAFDASVWEIWPALAAGAALYLPAPDTRVSPPRLRDWLLACAITIAFAPTPLAEQVIALPWPSASPLRTLLTGGDQLRGYPAARLPFALVNHYGPTENTVVATAGVVPPREQAARAPDLGRPIGNVQVHVLDRQGQPTPIGVAGEIYVGGVQVARGYHQRPDLTAARFVPDPFAAEVGARLYRTGDVGRWRADGRLEFLGRNDGQVKLRGFRIELGEIEAALQAHPQIRQSVVLAREDQAGQKRLVAYVVAEQGNRVASGRTREQTESQAHSTQNHGEAEDSSWFVGHPPGIRVAAVPSSADLRAFLGARLPEYMVPSAFVFLHQLPLTPNGKIDRKALPAPERATVNEQLALPRTEAERQLARIWADLLGLEQVGIHDNFFALGGDSILSMQIIARAAQQGLHLIPRQIFQHQTIAELAAAASASQPTIEQGLVVGDVPLTPIQHWFFEQPLAAPHHWNLALLLEVPPALDAERLNAALDHLAQHHDALRLRFFRERDGWRQTTAGSEAVVPCQSLDLSGLSAPEQAAAIEAQATEIQSSLDMTTGPIAQAVYFNRGPDRSGRLLIVAHHLVIDAVSWRILLEDLQTAYEQLSRGTTAQLPPKTTSYQQWAAHLRDYARTQELLAEWDYWREALPTEAARVPCDDPHGSNSEASAALATRRLSAARTQALLHEVHQAHQTRIDDVLLTAMLLTLAPWIGDSAVLVDLDRHGRADRFEQLNLSRTVGWFTAVVPVLLSMDSPADIERGLQAVKAQLQRIPHAGFGYGVLRYLSDVPEIVEHMRALPQAEINFNYLGQIDQVLGGSLIRGLTDESIGPTRSPESARRYLIEINAVMIAGQLQVTWVYSTNRHQPATIECLADSFMHTLQAIIDHCLAVQKD
ncbi:MAG TPA: amino acid adenylation domain-containing protein, partial [Herpetosiphonaceae bacterium]